MHWNGRFCPWRQQPVISYSTSIVEWWAYQSTVCAECPCLRHTQPTLTHTPPCATLKGGRCRVPPHRQLEMWSSPVLALRSHPLSSCTSKRQRARYMSCLSFLGITTQNMTLHCLYVNAAYVGFVNSFFPLFEGRCAFNGGEGIFLWGLCRDNVYTLTCGRGGAFCASCPLPPCLSTAPTSPLSPSAVLLSLNIVMYSIVLGLRKLQSLETKD